jgi:hypothetical protein
MDPYRAGIELAEKLITIQPEVIFLFPTIHYRGSAEMAEAIYDVINSRSTVVIGNTVDGFYELNKVAGVGVSALGLNSDGKVKWHLKYEKNIGKSPFAATEKCLNRLNEECRGSSPALYFLASDFRTDSDEIVAALAATATGPVVGGLAGDDYSFEECFVYANNHVLKDSIAILAIEGSFSFDISVTNSLQPEGSPGIITSCRGTEVQSIDNIPAMDFIKRELGKPLEVVDQGTIVFKLIEEEYPGGHRITGLLLPDNRMMNSSIRISGSIQQGKQIQVCLAPPERILQDVIDIGKSLNNLPFTPVAALLVSCAGRKRVLADSTGNEVLEVLNSCPSLKALVGFPSFGEFGPLKNPDGYSRPMFHNMTFILLLIGD